MEYKVVRMPRYSAESIHLVKAQAVANRVKLPKEVINPEFCPLCGREMEIVEATVRVGYRKCKSCDYGQPVLELKEIKVRNVIATLGTGILVGFGIAALAYLINQALKEKREQEKRELN